MLDEDQQRILGLLAARGLATSVDLQRATGASQPTVSRLLASLSKEVVRVGHARRARYGLPKSIHGLPARQPLWWTDERGAVERLGTLTLLARDAVHVEAGFGDFATRNVLPWLLTPLAAQGFLGRVLAQRLAAHGLGSDPHRWSVESALFAALQLHDGPGAITLGEPAAAAAHNVLPTNENELPAALDALSLDVAKTLPAGSSAAGEQPKFLALFDDGRHVIVKFTPPHGTPFGDRWRDLLQAERLASAVLAAHGVPVAATRVVESRKRAYLISERFDRVGRRGRRHVISVGAAHDAFVPEPSRSNWAVICEALARQRRLSDEDARRAAALLQFGRLIGNSDMHSGNLSLFVQRHDLGKARFTLAPLYDMLPMRWRPDPTLGGAPDYAPFEPDAAALSGAAVVPAREFWARLADLADASAALQRVARQMHTQLSTAG